MTSVATVWADLRRDVERIGWHAHETGVVKGVAEGEGCDLCDGMAAFWMPKVAAALQTEAPRTIDAARRQRTELARRMGLLVAAPASVIAEPVPSKPAPSALVVQHDLPVRAVAAPVLLPDDEIDDNMVVVSETHRSPVVAPSPVATFTLTPPTAESIRRNRKKR